MDTLSTPERDESDRLIPPKVAAAQFGVSTRSLRRWHSLGLIRAKRTVGGHRRYLESDVRALLTELEDAVAEYLKAVTHPAEAVA